MKTENTEDEKIKKKGSCKTTIGTAESVRCLRSWFCESSWLGIDSSVGTKWLGVVQRILEVGDMVGRSVLVEGRGSLSRELV